MLLQKQVKKEEIYLGLQLPAACCWDGILHRVFGQDRLSRLRMTLLKWKIDVKFRQKEAFRQTSNVNGIDLMREIRFLKVVPQKGYLI